MSRNVCVNSGSMRFVQNISVGPHVFQANEPIASGGNDLGLDPHELLLAALGACASITVRCTPVESSGLLRGCISICRT